jgi:hypothetical protein
VSRAHARYERILAEAMRAEDPVARLRRAARDRALPAATRRALASADEDGIRMAALLVARLRFERLMQGSSEALAFFESDPETFAEAFRRYHHQVAPTESFPMGEARLWSEWRATSPGRRGRAYRSRTGSRP